MPDQTPEQREAALKLAKRFSDSPEWSGELARALLSEHAENMRLREALKAERERCSKVASMFSMKPDRNIHPGIPWEQMNEPAKIAAHTTAQQIAWAIMEDPEGGAALSGSPATEAETKV